MQGDSSQSGSDNQSQGPLTFIAMVGRIQGPPPHFPSPTMQQSAIALSFCPRWLQLLSGGAITADQTTIIFRLTNFTNNVAVTGFGGAVYGVASFFHNVNLSFCVAASSWADGSLKPCFKQYQDCNQRPPGSPNMAWAAFCSTPIPPAHNSWASHGARIISSRGSKWKDWILDGLGAIPSFSNSLREHLRPFTSLMVAEHFAKACPHPASLATRENTRGVPGTDNFLSCMGVDWFPHPNSCALFVVIGIHRSCVLRA